MSRAKLVRRLEAYWRLEALNVVFVPFFAAFLVHEAGDRVSWPLVLTMAATAFLLIVGACAWRMELNSLNRRPAFERSVLPWLALARSVAISLVCASIAAAIYEVIRDGGWSPSAIAAVSLSVLAGLEYVNYYIVQLQHFDHAADLQRLIRGRGFREAHLARALRRWRAARGH